MVTQSSINTRKPIEVAQGGIGVATLTTAFAPVCAGTSATGPVQVASTNMSNSGYVLTSTGSSSLPTWQANAAGAGALVLIQTQTVTNVSAVTFTSGITSTYNSYVLIFHNVTSDLIGSNVSSFDVQISTNGGASYISSGYSYSAGSPGAASLGLKLRFGTLNTLSYAGTANIYNLTSGSGYISQVCQSGSLSSSSTASIPAYVNSYYVTPSTIANAIQIVVNNSFSIPYIISGTFSLYAYTK